MISLGSLGSIPEKLKNIVRGTIFASDYPLNPWNWICFCSIHYQNISNTKWFYNQASPVQVKNSVSVYIDSDRDSIRDRDKYNREKNYVDRVRDAK